MWRAGRIPLRGMPRRVVADFAFAVRPGMEIDCLSCCASGLTPRQLIRPRPSIYCSGSRIGSHIALAYQSVIFGDMSVNIYKTIEREVSHRSLGKTTLAVLRSTFSSIQPRFAYSLSTCAQSRMMYGPCLEFFRRNLHSVNLNSLSQVQFRLTGPSQVST